MASTLTHPSGVPPHQLSSTLAATSAQSPPTRELHDVVADFHYYVDPVGGGPPAPTYIGKPESYDRSTDDRSVTVHDIRGTEVQYTLDKAGFQIYHHQSVEKDFLDDDQIKQVYYPEIEQLLKDAFVTPFIFSREDQWLLSRAMEPGKTQSMLTRGAAPAHPKSSSSTIPFGARL